jgi:hypothetical protein
MQEWQNYPMLLAICWNNLYKPVGNTLSWEISVNVTYTFTVELLWNV